MGNQSYSFGGFQRREHPCKEINEQLGKFFFFKKINLQESEKKGFDKAS